VEKGTGTTPGVMAKTDAVTPELKVSQNNFV
jgi:hypothetical protein